MAKPQFETKTVAFWHIAAPQATASGLTGRSTRTPVTSGVRRLESTTTPLTLDQFLDLDMSFPGISFGYASWALESHLGVIEEQIDHARAQYRLRAERELGATKDQKPLRQYSGLYAKVFPLQPIQSTFGGRPAR